MFYFKKLNNITGWLVFAIATLTYILTVEPTASFWDCGEFIAASYKLQVPHPPGAPFFLLLGRMFSFLAGGDVEKVAYAINISSVLLSSFSILFLFWSITMLGIKLLPTLTYNTNNYGDSNTFEPSKSQTHLLMGAGAVGALAYTFSDSFWFSAVEAEVYAMSSFFTAFVFWAMLKWDRIDTADQQRSNRWLILIAYMIGLSIGVHLLNLVAIPALGMIYYYKKYKTTTLKGTITALALSGFIILFVMLGVIPGLPSIAGSIEVFFVNSMGMPFGVGLAFFVVMLLSGLVYSIYYSIKHKKVLLNTALMSVAFILIGYASYGMVLIRSQYNPPIDENNPEDIVSFVSYLKREQYGDRPLFYGPKFTSSPIKYEDTDPIYRKDAKKGKYIVIGKKTKTTFDKNVLFPRLHSRGEGHEDLYAGMLGLTKDEATGEYEEPTFKHNVQFLFTYQLGTMYLRYFGWNFVGRESDAEGAGSLSPFASDKGLPKSITENKARNRFYALPLLLGVMGFFFTFLRDKKVFIMTTLLFFLTGIALVLYLNSPPTEPRERDYIYVGSFYAFAIWIGLGVMALSEWISTLIKNKNKAEILAPMIATVIGSIIPIIMLQQGWDDHNRSGRYHSVDSAKNLLNSCAPNAILFTGGDNDTFPLWYVQEVEGYRTDVRVCNLSLLGTDWYAGQMKTAAYESAPLPISLEEKDFRQGINERIVVYPSPYLSKEEAQKVYKNGVPLKEYLKLLKEGSKFTQGLMVRFAEEAKDGSGGYTTRSQMFRLDDYARTQSIENIISIDTVTTIPSAKLLVETPLDQIKGQIPPDADSLVSSAMGWNSDRSTFYKDDLLILDMIANNNWKRPIYFSTTLGQSQNLGLQEYLQLEGLAKRLVPAQVGYKGEQGVMEYVNTDIMYKNMVKGEQIMLNGKSFDKKFYYRELDNPKRYYDENYYRFIYNLRSNFETLARQLLVENKKEKARETILFALAKMPPSVFKHDIYTAQMVGALLEAGETKLALPYCDEVSKQVQAQLDYMYEKGINDRRERYMCYVMLQSIENSLRTSKNIVEADKIKNMMTTKYKELMKEFNRKRETAPEIPVEMLPKKDSVKK